MDQATGYALPVANLHRRRWQIELWCKWIKQNLKIKAFYGPSRNAVLIQIWTTLIAYLLPVRLRLKSKVGWELPDFTHLAQTIFLERGDLWAKLCPRPPDRIRCLNRKIQQLCPQKRLGRTLHPDPQGQVIYGRVFQNLQEVWEAVRHFVDREWLMEKNGFQSPWQARAQWLAQGSLTRTA